MPSRRFPDRLRMPGQGCKWHELGGSGLYGHRLVDAGNGVRKVDDIIVSVGRRQKLCLGSHFHILIYVLIYVLICVLILAHFLLHYALWPPICVFRSLAVAPSSRFMPFNTAFFPNRFRISSIASWSFRSFSDCFFSCCFFSCSFFC